MSCPSPSASHTTPLPLFWPACSTTLPPSAHSSCSPVFAGQSRCWKADLSTLFGQVIKHVEDHMRTSAPPAAFGGVKLVHLCHPLNRILTTKSPNSRHLTTTIFATPASQLW